MPTKLSCMVVSLLCLTLPSLIAAGKHKNAFFFPNQQAAVIV